MSAPLNPPLDLARICAVAAEASIRQALRERGRLSDPAVPEAQAQPAAVLNDARKLVRRGSR